MSKVEVFKNRNDCRIGTRDEAFAAQAEESCVFTAALENACVFNTALALERDCPCPDIAEPPPPTPTSCMDVVAVTTYSDDFNRADSISLGANWTEYTELVGFSYGYGFDVAANRLRALGFQGPFPNGTPRTSAAAWTAFPASTTHQTSRLIFKRSYLEGPKDTQIVNYDLQYGGPAVRIQQVGVGNLFDPNSSMYTLRYAEIRDFHAPYNILFAFLELWLHRPAGIEILTPAIQGFGVYAFPGSTHLNDGDELKITAMNFEPTPGTTYTCLKGYVNDVRLLGVTVSNPTLQLLTGKAGISSGSGNGTEQGFGVDWDDWEGAVAEPV